MRGKFGLCLGALALLQACDQEPLSVRKSSFEDGPLSESLWVASHKDWEFTLELDGDLRSPDGGRILTGTLSGNQPDCFLPSPLTATLDEQSLRSLNRSRTETADQAYIQLSGVMEPSSMRAQITLSVHANDCDLQEELSKRCQLVEQEFLFKRKTPSP